MTNLSMAFDCLGDELIITKLNAYGFMLSALELIHNYLSSRKHRTKLNSSYNEILKIAFVNIQGLIFGPLLFNIFSRLIIIVDDIEIAN